MARNLAVLLIAAWANNVPALSTNASALSALISSGERKTVCRYCHKLCPISCFVGTCGLHLPYSVRKYEASNQCYSCDPAVSVGISRDGDYLRCEADETGENPGGKSPFSQQQGMKQGPQGPAIPGNAGLAAMKASQQAQLAVAAATKASILADEAAKAATAKYREATAVSGDGKQFFSDEAQAENHQTATQIRAEEALRVAEAAHTAWKGAMAEYNKEVEKLRRQQLITDQAEKALEAAEANSEHARGQYAAMQAEAQHAVEQAMLLGGSAASKITSQAASEELAGAAMAAHRRLVIAAKEAKDASSKIAIASAMAPCLDQSKTSSKDGVVGCDSVALMASKQQQDQNRATPRGKMLVQPVLPNAPPPSTVSFSISKASIAGLEPEVEEPAVPAEGQLEVPSIEQQLTANLAEKLGENPAAVQDPAIFSVPNVPFTAQQAPMDGMEQPESFDLSTISALQKSERRMLRKGSTNH